ncbi:MAG: putative endonuclease [Candidatus Endobugula sp.]
MLTAQDIGKKAENAAKEFLQQQGLRIIKENYFCRRGEIDLIMQDTHHLVFIEVKYRRNNHYGSGLEAVTYKKQQKIINTARHYLYKQGLTETNASRFDIVSVYPNTQSDLNSENSPFSIHWIKHAFIPTNTL